MNINDQEILTPFDDPIAYQLDWRHLVVLAAYDRKTDIVTIPFKLWCDDDLRRYAMYIRYRARRPQDDDVVPPRHTRLAQWHQHTTGRLVGAYLVTNATYAQIATDLGLDADEIRLYGSLFDDVRDQQGRPIAGVLTRLRAEMAANQATDPLRRTALMAGLPGLRAALDSVQAEEPQELLDRLVESELTRRVMSGQMRTAELARLQASTNLRQRLDAQQSPDRQSTEVMKLAMEIIGVTAPHMLRIEQTAAELEASNVAIESRIASQRTATGMPTPETVVRSEQALEHLLSTHLGSKAKAGG